MCTSVNAPLWTLQFKGGGGRGEEGGLSKGASRRAEGLLELLEVVSAGFWCQEHVLRFRGKSSPQPLLPSPPPALDRLDRPHSSRFFPTTSRGDEKKRNGKKEGKRKKPALPTSNNEREIIEIEREAWN